MSRIYLASSWRNQEQPAVVEALRKQGHEVYDFRRPSTGGPVESRHPGLENGFAWGEIDPSWQGWDPERFRDLLVTHPTAEAGYGQDMGAMLWADTCVLLLPCGRSAHLEAGWFVGSGKRLIVLLAPEKFEPELMYLMAGEIVTSLEELLAGLCETEMVRGSRTMPR